MAAEKVLDIRNLSDYTNQEIFDYVVTKLRKQGQASVITWSESRCAYRGDNGLKCAVGWLIPDSHYLPSMESKTVSCVLMDYFGLEVSQLASERVRLLGNLQWVHDCAIRSGGRVWEPEELMVEWEKLWKKLATEFGLEYKPPIEAS